MMLQRAASNAYSWWWASHIRTKQSKWLEQNLQDMEEKVAYTLSIINEDGETFAQRAEMYYRKRPEIVNFVEEAFRSYRALAERYDHLSKELQSANRTIATAFPEQVQFALEDDDDEIADKKPSNLHLVPKAPSPPKAPEIPKKVYRSQSALLRGKTLNRILSPASTKNAVEPSGLSTEEALEEIDRLQKEILALQTKKEFVKASYEKAYQTYWEIDDEISDMQKRVCSLQDEFGIGSVIEDAEARTLMASTALGSCKEKIAKLEEMQKRSEDEMKMEKGRIKEAHKTLERVAHDLLPDEGKKSIDHEDDEFEDESDKNETGDQALPEKMESEPVVDPGSPMTVGQLAERVDELVERVASLETTAASQNALVSNLRLQIDGLYENIRSLESDKESLLAGCEDMNGRIKVLEDELRQLKSLYHKAESQNRDLHTHFTVANSDIKNLSEKLDGVKMDEDAEGTGLLQAIKPVPEDKLEDATDAEETLDESVMNTETESKNEEKEERNEGEKNGRSGVEPEETQELSQEEKPDKKDFSEIAITCFGTEHDDHEESDYDYQHDWRQIFPSGLEDREKILLEEYMSVLKNYGLVKKKLTDVEKKNRDGFFELALQIRELKNAVVYRDVEIQSLRQKLNLTGKVSDPTEGNQSEYCYSNMEGLRESISHLSISPVSNFSFLSSQQHEDTKTPLVKTKVKEKRAKGREGSPGSIPTVEERIRQDIDELLEDNLEFWLRFSTSIHQINRFQTSVQDLKSELVKLKDNKRHDTRSQSVLSEAKPIYRHLREIRTELQLWLENNTSLKDELQARYSSLCNIQDEISTVTTHSVVKGGATEISEYQAAKFHGEVLNMKQENTKVSSELHTGLDKVKALKVDVDRTLAKLEGDLGISAAKNKADQTPSRSSSGRSRIPLRSFLFGVKLKKQNQKNQRTSLFSCVGPALQKQYSYITPPEKLPK